MPWTDVIRQIGDMNEKIEAFSNRCKKLPARLREYNAFKTLRVQIEDFQTILPLLQELSKERICDRHWEEVRSEHRLHLKQIDTATLLGMAPIDPILDPD